MGCVMGRKKIRELAEEIGKRAKGKREISINQQGADNLAIVGDNNIVHMEKLSTKELRNLKGRLDDWANLEMETNGLSIGEARKKVYGIFNRKFKLTSYKDLPASKLQDALSFIQGQINKLENKLLRMGIEGTPKHRTILKIYRLRSFLNHLSEEDFIKLLLDRFGKVNFAEFTVKELKVLERILMGMR